jgi:multiple sugar transport system permease protein
VRLTATRRSGVIVHGALIFAAIIVLVPTLWVISAGFRTQISLLSGELTFHPTLKALLDVLSSRSSDFLLNFRNSLVVASASTVICLFAGTLGAWSMHRMGWPRWVPLLFLGFVLLFQMLPPVALAGAWFTIARGVGLDNTLTGLVLAHATLNLPTALWLMGIFVRDVPRELEEAASIDGASTPVLLRHVVLPLLAPGLAATGVLLFVFSWNEFAVALNLTTKLSSTVPVGIAKYAQGFEIQYTQMAASAALSIIPAVIVLLIGQRYIVKGLTAGAVK